MDIIKIVLVDDHDILMDGIASILSDANHLQVVGKAPNIPMAKELIKLHLPDIVFTDISMGDISGLELTKFIKVHFPLTRTIVLTMHDNVHYISSLLKSGATGYLLKSVRQEELFTAIEQVLAGQQYIQQSLLASYKKSLLDKNTESKQFQLSPREIEIIRLIAQELTTAEISKQLFLSELTVETHRKNIGRKTGVKTSIGLLNYAMENGLL